MVLKTDSSLAKIKKLFGPWFQTLLEPQYDGNIMNVSTWRFIKKPTNSDKKDFSANLTELYCGNPQTTQDPLFKTFRHPGGPTWNYKSKKGRKLQGSIQCAPRCNVTPHVTTIDVKNGRDKDLLEHTCNQTCDNVKKKWTGTFTSIYSKTKDTRFPMPPEKTSDNLTCYCGVKPNRGVCEN